MGNLPEQQLFNFTLQLVLSHQDRLQDPRGDQYFEALSKNFMFTPGCREPRSAVYHLHNPG